MPGAPDMSLAESWSCFLHDLGVWVGHEATQTAEGTRSSRRCPMTCTAAYIGDAHIGLDFVFLIVHQHMGFNNDDTEQRRLTHKKSDSTDPSHENSY